MTHHDFITKVGQFIASHRLLNNDKTVLAAVSGGADSVALLLALQELGYHVLVAHCNFGLRGAESDRDEQFVRSLCAKLQVPLQVTHFDVPAYASEHGVSVEMACRDLRYAWFQQLAAEHDCQAVAVAHHRDDNVETFMLNALRGTGIAGLRAMRPRGNQPVPVVRPLLGVSRADILDFLAAAGQGFVTDSSNLVSDVKRNRLRNVVLPALRQQFPDADARLADTVSHVAHDEALLNELVTRAANGVIANTENGFTIDLNGLFEFVNSTQLLFAIIKPQGFSYEQCGAILRSARGENSVGKTFSSSTHTLSINRGKLEVFVLEAVVEEMHVINLCDKKIETPVPIAIRRVDGLQFSPKMCDGRTTIALGTDVLQAREVVLRRWRTGDRFAPFGMKGTKLVSDLFTDLKLGRREKGDVWLMVADGKILWVLGHRASREFQVPKGATSYLLLSLTTE